MVTLGWNEAVSRSLDNGAVAFFGDRTDGGQSYTDSTIPVDISKELVNFSPSGGAVTEPEPCS